MPNDCNDDRLATHATLAGRKSDRGPAPGVAIDPDRVLLMHRVLPAQTRDAINATFGISYNTWNKIKRGAPIRSSVALRLIDRLDSLTSQST